MRSCDGFTKLDAGGIDPRRRVIGAKLAAGAGRYGERRVAEPNHNTIKRQPHHLRGRLRDDGVTPRADVGHVRFDGHNALIIETHAGARLHRDIVADGAGHTHTDQPPAVPHLAGPGVARRPAELVGADLQALV